MKSQNTTESKGLLAERYPSFLPRENYENISQYQGNMPEEDKDEDERVGEQLTLLRFFRILSSLLPSSFLFRFLISILLLPNLQLIQKRQDLFLKN